MDRSVFLGAVESADEREDSSSCSICCLGADQILGILQKLPVRSILAFGMTCSRFRGLADSDALWALVFRREWGNRTVDAWLDLGRNIKIGWKGLHRQMLALGSITWHRLYQGDFAPPARASHSLVSFSDKVTIFGGGYDGGMSMPADFVFFSHLRPSVINQFSIQGSMIFTLFKGDIQETTVPYTFVVTILHGIAHTVLRSLEDHMPWLLIYIWGGFVCLGVKDVVYVTKFCSWTSTLSTNEFIGQYEGNLIVLRQCCCHR